MTSSNDEIMQLLHEVLVDIKININDIDPEYGICSEVLTRFVQKEKNTPWVLIGELWSSWEKFSGDVGYPIPSFEEGESAADCYFRHSANEMLWTGEQRTLRLELLNFLIEETKELV